jgi:toxin CptA
VIVVATILAFSIGFALQRGRICAVLAVQEGVEQGRWRRFLSLLECAGWAMIGLLAADALGIKPLSAWAWTSSLPLAAAGGAVFGVGALVNGSCAFGSATRLASGEVSLIALVAGFVVGFGFMQGGGLSAPVSPVDLELAASAGGFLALGLASFAAWRLGQVLRAGLSPSVAIGHLSAPRWPPGLAMFVIGAANVALVMAAANWSYLSVLGDAVTGSGAVTWPRLLTIAFFFAGAVVGALTAGRFRWRGASWAELALRLVAGVLMGAGASLIPGGNDALILFGMPLLQPAAFAAFAAMVATMALAFALRRAMSRFTRRGG